MITLAAIGFLFKRAFWLVVDNWKVILPVVVVLLVIVFAYRSCKRTPTIDIERIEKINKANETERKQELREVIYQNLETVKTVDERNVITDIHVAAQDAAIEAKIKEADKIIVEAKRGGGKDITGPQLECILTGVCE